MNTSHTTEILTPATEQPLYNRRRTDDEYLDINQTAILIHCGPNRTLELGKYGLKIHLHESTMPAPLASACRRGDQVTGRLARIHQQHGGTVPGPLRLYAESSKLLQQAMPSPAGTGQWGDDLFARHEGENDRLVG